MNAFHDTTIVRTVEIKYAHARFGKDISLHTAREIIKGFKTVRFENGKYIADAEEFVEFLKKRFKTQMEKARLDDKSAAEIYNYIANWVEDDYYKSKKIKKFL